VSGYAGPGIEFDEAAFDPMKVAVVSHQLMGHPLLQMDKLVALGRRLAAHKSVRWHDDQASPDTSFHHAPETNRAQWSAEETIERIEEARAWCSLLNVQQDPEYRALVDEVLDHVKPRIDRVDPGMCYRGGWIFISSPGAVTPFHIDHEHNFILQVRGTKTVHVWEPLDREVLTEQALELFHGVYRRDRVTWREELEARGHAFEFSPGMGAYMPTTAPHWVKNGPGVSVTVSFTYYTDLTTRRKLLHRANHLLRERGLVPAPVGASPVADGVKLAAYRTVRAGTRLVKRLRGVPGEQLDAAYAIP
jgi:hypothetical protein